MTDQTESSLFVGFVMHEHIEKNSILFELQ